MRGASADALSALSQVLTGVNAQDGAAVGTDLFGVAQLLRSEPALRRTSTDASLDGSAKSGLVKSLLEGKVGQVALDLVADAVSRKWTTTRDLADALEYLGVVSLVRSAGDKQRLADELFGASTLISHESELRNALSDPARSVADKRSLLGGIFGDKVLPATLHLIEQSLAGSYRTVNAALENYQQVAAEVYGESVATVHSAQTLSESDIARLSTALSNHYGRQVHLNVIVDPALVGGLRVEIGDDVIDGSLSSRLDDARRKLAY
ncbi:MAG: F0F1 ATP synthase subunit delta [Marmoricola sp.]